MQANNVFNDQWRKCLLEHLKVLIAENRNIEGIKEALVLAGFSNSEIQAYFVNETMTIATASDIVTAQSFVETLDACT